MASSKSNNYILISSVLVVAGVSYVALKKANSLKKSSDSKEISSSSSKTNVVPPTFDEADDLGKSTGYDINGLVKSLWKKRFESPFDPKSKPDEVRKEIPVDVPFEGQNLKQLMKDTVKTLTSHSRRIQHPGYLGFLAPQGVATDPMAFALKPLLNQNCVAFDSSPIAAITESTVIGWLNKMVGYDEKTCSGVLLSGGSTSNLTAVATALVHRFGPDYRKVGLVELAKGQRPVVLCSENAHFCVQRAAGMLGIGVGNVITIPVDNETRCMRIDKLKEAVEANPCVVCVVASAGTTATGAIDPIDECAEICAEKNIWLHVDAAYGGSCVMSHELRPRLKGLEKADSITMDMHKWFYMSLDCSAILYKNTEIVTALWKEQSNVVKQLSLDSFLATNVFFLLGPELSRRMRALPVYVAFRHYGVDRLGRNVLFNVKCAEYVYERVMEDPDLSIVVKPQLSVTIFRYKPEGVELEDKRVDELNAHIRSTLEQEGDYFLSGCVMDERPVLRVCFVNHQTRISHINTLIDRIKSIGKAWVAENK